MNIRDWAAVRAAYENGASRETLMAEYGISDRALGRHIQQENWQRRPAAARRERLEALYGRVLSRLEQAADALDGSAADADKLSKLLAAAEKLDKLSPAPETGQAAAIRVELGDAADYAE